MAKIPTCRMCGRCCHYVHQTIPDPLTGIIVKRVKRCKHLVRLRSGKTLCRIYAKRNFMLNDGSNPVIDRAVNDKGIKVPVICVHREQYKYNYAGCSFNALTKKNEDFEVYVSAQGLTVPWDY